ncbi:AsmA-like C-terminal region-containing protein [Pseudooceanicola nitratireducens]|uniref:YhdP family protein n=1 Tax=Pseudooceanicola nitratireducens TaxID=517719 RepID=UPI0023F1B886|nr:AsmA-like C-terminal region-containing protein [Pseudooceanicola nitratireducens]
MSETPQSPKDTAAPEAGDAGVASGQSGAGQTGVGQTSSGQNNSGQTGEAGKGFGRTLTGRMLRGFALGVLSFVLLVVIAGAALLWYARGTDFAAPPWVKARIDARLAQELPDLAIAFDDLTLSVSDSYQPSLHLTDMRIRTAAGGDQIVLSDVTGSFDKAALLEGQVRPRVISVTGARIHVSRDANGRVGVAFGADQNAPPALAGGLDAAQTMGAISTLLDRPAFAKLRRIEGSNLIVQYEDRQAGRSWIVDGGVLGLSRDGEALKLNGNFALLGGHAFATTIELAVNARMHSPAATLSLAVQDAPARDIATQSPGLAWLGVLDAPISGALRVSMDDQGVIGPLNGTLQMGKGALAPDQTADPIPFDSARTYFTYDPARLRLTFSEIAVKSAWIEAVAEGRIDLTEVSGALPDAMIGQLRITELMVNPAGIYPAPLFLERAEADMRVTFDPFRLDLGRLDLRDRGQTLTLAGWVAAQPEGWDLSLTGRVPELTADDLLELWPPGALEKTRGWVAKNVLDGRVSDVQLGIRSQPEARPDLMLGFDFDDLITTFAPGFPPIDSASGHGELRGDRLVITADNGRIYAAEGEGLEIGGTSFIYENTRIKRGPAEVRVKARGEIGEVLSLIDSDPLRILTKAGRSPDLAQGQADVTAQLNFNLVKPLAADQIRVTYQAELREVTSDVILPERRFSADHLHVEGTARQIAVTGEADLGGIPVGGTWSSEFGPDAPGGSRVDGWVEVSEAVAAQLNLGLEPGTLGGTGRADIALNLPKGGVPSFDLRSDLSGISLSLAALNWSLGAKQTGELAVTGTLGKPARIDALSVSAPGLSASGAISLREGGGLDAARFDRVRIGGWLDAPVTLTGRSKGTSPAVAITGGTLDLRNASLGGGKAGKGGPLAVSLDRLTISDTLALRNMRGDFTTQGGMQGQFTGALNGSARIDGTIVPRNGQSAVRIRSDNAGAVLSAAGLMKKGRDGTLDLTLNPTGAKGTYDGVLAVRNIWLQDAPSMASLLSAVSVVGLLEQMSGNGIQFTHVDADFRLTPTQVILRKSSATGASMGIAMDGYYDLGRKVLDMQGVLSPVYAINGIGQFLTRKGEGLIGFNYRLTGPAAQPKVAVNPLSIFTPGMFREIFRRPPPTTN